MVLSIFLFILCSNAMFDDSPVQLTAENVNILAIWAQLVGYGFGAKCPEKVKEYQHFSKLVQKQLWDSGYWR